MNSDTASTVHYRGWQVGRVHHGDRDVAVHAHDGAKNTTVGFRVRGPMRLTRPIQLQKDGGRKKEMIIHFQRL
jgi:hypothetical protein